MGRSIAKRKVELENVGVNDSALKHIDSLDSSEASSKPHLLHRKYLRPKYQKGVSPKFPQGCGRLDNASSSKCEILPNVKPLVETIQTANEQITCEYHENESAFAREVEEGEILEDIDDELKAETGKGTEVENDKLFDLQTNLKCQMAYADGDKSQVGRIGRDSEKCIRYKLGGDKPGSVDLPPSFGGSVTAMQQGKRIYNRALTEATVGCKDKKYVFMGANQSNHLNLKQDGNNVSECNFAKEDSEYSDTVSDDSGKHGDTSIVLSNSQADLSRRKVREALNLFKQILEKRLLNERKVSLYTYVDVAMQLKEQGKWVNMNERVLGAVPGVEIGDKFHCRAELVIIGLHRPFAAGIDFMEKDGKKIATSIVASGRYVNETEFTDVLIYSGEGGNPAIKDKKLEDQTLVRGNLALKNSMEAGTPVRVIRGCRVWKSYRAGDRKREKEATFTYDGLYVVSKYWQDKGKYGKLVYMFQLNKMQCQPNLSPNMLSSSGKSKILSKSRLSKALCKSGKSKLLSRSERSKVRHDNRMVDDISCGKEKIPIRIVNGIDNEKPPIFNYIANMVYPQLNESSMTRCCQCIDGCSDYVKCSCVIKNRGTVPYNENGAIVRRRPIVYECGPFCKCPPSCKNRVSQRGVQFQLEVFKTESRGWGVRSRNFISSGSFICEYVGELLNDKQADERIDCDEYLFDLGDGDGFAIDAAQFGNIGRFLNHSCSPNLYAQDVLFDHDNKRMPHVMLFATENIPPLQELTFHYNYKIGQVYDMNGNVKKKTCCCGARDCTGRMY